MPMPLPMSPPVTASQQSHTETVETGAKRRSNEVAEFEYVYWKQVVVTFFAVISVILALPIWPFIMTAKTGNRSYRRRYFHSILSVLVKIPSFFTYGTLSRGFRYNLLLTPEETKRRLSLREGACTRCAKCCQQLDCVFLGSTEAGDHMCTVYGGLYWHYGTCGRYPLSQKDVDDHACPGFSFLDESGKALIEV